MNRKKELLICCLVAIFSFAAVTCFLMGYNRIHSASKTNTLQLKQKGPAELKISAYNNPEAIISVNTLNSILNDPNLVILDARGRSFQVFEASYPAGHIPGAIPILYSEYTHPAFHDRITTPILLEKVLSDKGLNNQKRIVIYGNDGLQARIYWMLKMYGCDNKIQILDGGVENWQAAGLQTTGAVPVITPAQFMFNPTKGDPNIYTNLEEIMDSILNYTPNTIIVDARTRNEYIRGHIPCSVNMSPSDFLNEDATFKPDHELAAVLARKGISPDKEVLVYSYDGVMSSLLWYVLHELMAFPNVKNNDGGFFEWIERELVIEYGEQQLVVKPAQ